MEQETKLVEVSLPLHTHFNTPDKNKRIFSKTAFEKALYKANEMYKDEGGIPVELYPNKTAMEDLLLVDITKMVGRVSDISTETMTGNLKLNPLNENAKIAIAGIESGMKLSFGLRGIGTAKFENGNTVCDIDRIISFQLIDASTNPCDATVFMKNPDDNEIVKNLAAEIRKQCENNLYSFMGDDQKEVRRQYEEALQKSADDWNSVHPGKEVELKLIYNEEKCNKQTLTASLSVTGPGAAEFKAYLDEEDNVNI